MYVHIFILTATETIGKVWKLRAHRHLAAALVAVGTHCCLHLRFLFALCHLVWCFLCSAATAEIPRNLFETMRCLPESCNRRDLCALWQISFIVRRSLFWLPMRRCTSDIRDTYLYIYICLYTYVHIPLCALCVHVDSRTHISTSSFRLFCLVWLCTSKNIHNKIYMSLFGLLAIIHVQRTRSLHRWAFEVCSIIVIWKPFQIQNIYFDTPSGRKC